MFEPRRNGDTATLIQTIPLDICPNPKGAIPIVRLPVRLTRLAPALNGAPSMQRPCRDASFGCVRMQPAWPASLLLGRLHAIGIPYHPSERFSRWPRWSAFASTSQRAAKAPRWHSSSFYCSICQVLQSIVSLSLGALITARNTAFCQARFALKSVQVCSRSVYLAAVWRQHMCTCPGKVRYICCCASFQEDFRFPSFSAYRSQWRRFPHEGCRL
ncbi:hypothetical protein J3F83DRAFT_749973 [Trichoderma novae-zelandiae]